MSEHEQKPDGPQGQPADAPEEESEASLKPSAELEAALLEALEAIPDGPLPGTPEKPQPQAQPSPAPPQPQPEMAMPPEEKKPDDELVLSNPVERSPQEEAHRLQIELTECNDRLLRLHADFENFRKRATREHQEAMQFGPQILVKDLLSVVDNLDRAIDHARQSEGGDLQGLLQGVELVQRELLTVLSKHHVTAVDAMGELFNPAFHEAMAQIAKEDAAPNTVIDVLQKGYQMRDRLLRPAKVVVTRAAEQGDGGQGEATE